MYFFPPSFIFYESQVSYYPEFRKNFGWYLVFVMTVFRSMFTDKSSLINVLKNSVRYESKDQNYVLFPTGFRIKDVSFKITISCLSPTNLSLYSLNITD